MLQIDEKKLLACVHCGLCLEACPTYVATGDENDGPRGRIYLMRAVAEGRLPNDSPAFTRHLDRCLGCRACEAVCPAGIEYGQLLESGRAEIFSSEARRSIGYRLASLFLKFVWSRPTLLRRVFSFARLIRDSGIARTLLASGLARLISPRFAFALALLESSASVRRSGAINEGSGPLKEIVPERKAGAPVLLFRGCVGEGLFARVNRASERVLKINGFSVKAADHEVCCGALHAHAGDLQGARRLARENLRAFSKDDDNTPIVTNAGGCGAMLVSYAHLFAGDAQFGELARKLTNRVCDVSQLLNETGPVAGEKLELPTFTYDASCHLLYGMGVRDEPVLALAKVPGLNFQPLQGAERCCGGAGIYNLLQPELSQTVLAEKLACIKKTEAGVLATGNPGCQMQIGAGALLAKLDLQVCHPVELLDDSYRAAGYYNNSNS